MRWAVHVARMVRGEVYTGFGLRNRRDIDHLEDQELHERIILRWFSRKWDVETWNGLI